MADTFSNAVMLDTIVSDESQVSSKHKNPVYLESFVHPHLSFSHVPTSSHLIKIVIHVGEQVVKKTYAQTVALFTQGSLDGFSANLIPAEYIQEHYKTEIAKKVKNFLFRHAIIDFLLTKSIEYKIPYANYPRLASIEEDKTGALNYHFDLSIADPIELKEWKHFAFKSPKRKKYKDLDKQVIHFLENEIACAKKQSSAVVEDSDWILFDALALDRNNKPIFNELARFWVKIKTKEVPSQFSNLFLDQPIGGSFTTNAFDLDDSTADDCNPRQFTFLITIRAITKGNYLSLEHFKGMFKLKNKIDIHNKLMEVFSYRNDISQRKTIIEEIFHLFLAKHRFEVPKHLVLRRQEDILLVLMKQTDYQVYKSQKDFLQQVELLAEKQLKEEIIIDQIATQENMKCDLKDIQQYLHLFNNKRLREFIYFKPLLEQIDEANRPVSSGILEQTALREKTLNHIIITLTR